MNFLIVPLLGIVALAIIIGVLLLVPYTLGHIAHIVFPGTVGSNCRSDPRMDKYGAGWSTILAIGVIYGILYGCGYVLQLIFPQFS